MQRLFFNGHALPPSPSILETIDTIVSTNIIGSNDLWYYGKKGMTIGVGTDRGEIALYTGMGCGVHRDRLWCTPQPEKEYSFLSIERVGLGKGKARLFKK
ncbi:MAG: hypothetical protein ACK5JU_11640 [Bacteroidales bacterium]